MVYFAYDITMDPRVLAETCGSKHALIFGTGYLLHRRLVFNRPDDRWHYAASFEPGYNHRVNGVLYGLHEDAAARLRSLYLPGCMQVDVRVQLRESSYALRAVTFMTESAAAEQDGATSPEYRDTLLRAALFHELPLDYISFLRSLEVMNPEPPA